MEAAVHGQVKIVQFLLPFAAGSVANDKCTALMLACFYNKPECAVLLEEKEAGMRDKDGEAALYFACRDGNVESLLIWKR